MGGNVKVRNVLLAGALVATSAIPLGLAATPAAAAPPALPSFTQVTTALRHSCGVTTAGAVWCWGTNAGTGALLGDAAIPAGAVLAHPVPVATAGSALEGKVVTDVDAGTHTTCAVTTEGKVACWGGDRFSGIGNGTYTGTAVPTSPDFSNSALAGKTIASVKVATTAACAISTDGALACWGDRPGTSATDTRPRDVDFTGTVLAGKAIRDVDTTGNNTCAVSTDGVLACWGYKQFNALGPHATADSLTPIPVDLTGSALAGKPIIDVTTDSNKSCALASDGTVGCWGTSNTGFTDYATTGTPLAGKTIAEIQERGVLCARTSTGAFACLGGNGDGQLGTSGGSTTAWTSPAFGGTPLAGKTIADLSVGTQTSCAVTTLGGVACWGKNGYGEGGNATCHDYLACAAAYGVPTAPTDVTVVAGPRSLTISWKPVASVAALPITGYRVNVGAVFFLNTTDVGPGATSVTVTGLSNGATYNVVVSASNELGRGPGNPSVAGTPAARPSSVAPFADWTAFTTQQFADLENRQPTAAELSAWTTALSADATEKGTQVEGIRRGTDNITAVDPAVRLYRAFLGRIPDASGLRFWVSRRRTGAWNLTRIADSFATSTEFKRKYGALTNEQFVTRIYTDVLRRDADPTGVDYWTRQLDLKRRTRGSVMVGFSESSEYKAKQADGTDVVVAYVYLLGRAPTAAEEASWISLRKGGNSHALLVRELLDSQEYADRID